MRRLSEKGQTILTNREIRHQEVQPMWDAVIEAYAEERMGIEEAKQSLDLLAHYVSFGMVHGVQPQTPRVAQPVALGMPVELMDEWDRIPKTVPFDWIESSNADSEGKRELED